jgi:hypothetical protein
VWDRRAIHRIDGRPRTYSPWIGNSPIFDGD